MADIPTNPPDKKEPIEKVLNEFDKKKELLEGFCIRTKSLIEDLLSDAGLRFQSIQARVKRREKLREKYLNAKKNYRTLDDITDQAALRVIVYYDDEIDIAAELIRREFKVLRTFLLIKGRQTLIGLDTPPSTWFAPILKQGKVTYSLKSMRPYALRFKSHPY